MPCPIEFSNLINSINQMTSLPWSPLYSQSQPGSDSDTDNDSVTYTYAMALTILFTVFVFAFEHMLDERQARSYRITTFPQQLKQTVSKIDDDAARNKKDVSDDDGNDDEKEPDKDNDKDDKKQGDKNKLDKDKPILPQLQEKFTKAQLYGTDKINFGMFSSLYNTLESVLFLIIGFLPYTWDYSVQISEEHFGWTEEENEIKISCVFLLLTTILGTVTALPFELYSTFLIEKKHGFNKQTPMLFFTDKIKSLLLTCVIGGPFVATLLKIIQVSDCWSQWSAVRYTYCVMWHTVQSSFEHKKVTQTCIYNHNLTINQNHTINSGEENTFTYTYGDSCSYSAHS